jgi:hypothetical protein
VALGQTTEREIERRACELAHAQPTSGSDERPLPCNVVSARHPRRLSQGEPSLRPCSQRDLLTPERPLRRGDSLGVCLAGDCFCEGVGGLSSSACKACLDAFEPMLIHASLRDTDRVARASVPDTPMGRCETLAPESRDRPPHREIDRTRLLERVTSERGVHHSVHHST